MLADQKTPKIPALDVTSQQPLWSVMIPAYNCKKYLAATLQSVLAQDPGREKMQIEVVDDASTEEGLEDLVREIGKGRVSYYRRSINGGVNANFNTCVLRSRGQLIHILHGDDWVAPGFYKKMETLAEENSETALLAARTFVADANGEIVREEDRVPELETKTSTVKIFFEKNPLQCAGVVVRRSFYEQYGGFCESLCHTADWEMWARAAAFGGGVMTGELLAYYRVYEGNHSSEMVRTAENLRDYLRLGEIFKSKYSEFPAEMFREKIYAGALWQAERLEREGQLEKAAAYRKLWRESQPRAAGFVSRLAQRVRALAGAFQ